MARASTQADIVQGQGDILEGQTYRQAAALADLNAAYRARSTAIQTTQADRALFMTLGMQRTAAAGSGSTGGGSAGAILRSSVQQGALNRSVIQQQGLITHAGYEEQASSYRLQQQAAGVAAEAQNVALEGQTQAAAAYKKEADLFKEGQVADYISGAISTLADIAGTAPAL
jgi:hypothetical protein